MNRCFLESRHGVIKLAVKGWSFDKIRNLIKTKQYQIRQIPVISDYTVTILIGNSEKNAPRIFSRVSYAMDWIVDTILDEGSGNSTDYDY